MSDIVDKANELVDLINSEALAEHKAATRHKYPYKEGEADFYCFECGVIVPPARRKLTGSEYCVECKEDLDSLGTSRC